MLRKTTDFRNHQCDLISDLLYYVCNMTGLKNKQLQSMLRALWLVVTHDLLEYRYMHDITGNLFSLFCLTCRAVLKMFVRLFRIKGKWKRRKTSQELFTKKKNGERREKELFTT